jgi:hypothetical protein
VDEFWSAMQIAVRSETLCSLQGPRQNHTSAGKDNPHEKSDIHFKNNP